MPAEEPYNRPALTTLFYFFGALNVVAAVVLFLLAVPTSSSSRNPHASSVFPALSLLPIGSALFAALLCFGIGQVIDLIGRIAHNSRLAVQGIREHNEAAAERAFALQILLAPGTARASVSPTNEHYYYLGGDGQPAGPLTLAELKGLARVGTIKENTLVCLEGRNDWQPLAAKVTL